MLVEQGRVTRPVRLLAVDFPRGRKRYLLSYMDRAIFLTAREFEVFTLLVQGASVVTLSARLMISQRTAEDYCATIKRKFGLRCKRQLHELRLLQDWNEGEQVHDGEGH